MSTTPTTIFAGIINVIDTLLAETREIKESITCEISELQRSMQDKEDAITKAATATIHAEAVDNLRETLQQHEEERGQIEKAKVTFEHRLASLRMSQEIIAQNIQYYNTKLQGCDEAIARTKAEIQGAEEEGLRSNRQGIHFLQTQLEEDRYGAWQLEGSLVEIDQRLSSSRLIKLLAELGSSGIVALITTLESNGVSLLDIIGDIKRVSINLPQRRNCKTNYIRVILAKLFKVTPALLTLSCKP
jgi:chromosome segregation ATPase